MSAVKSAGLSRVLKSIWWILTHIFEDFISFKEREREPEKRKGQRVKDKERERIPSTACTE